MSTLRRAAGYSLMEILVVLAIIGVLTTVAVPSYQKYARSTVRSQAMQFMAELAQQQERYFLDNQTYAGSLTQLKLLMPAEVAKHYSAPSLTVASNPPRFEAQLHPLTSSGNMLGDGSIRVDNRQKPWRHY